MAKKAADKKQPKKTRRKQNRLSNSDGIPAVGIKTYYAPVEPSNKFWEQKSKVGVDKLFSTPELMWRAALEYFKWCDENPLWEAKAVHNGGQLMITKIPKPRVYTMHGLCSYLDCNTEYFKVFKHQNKDVAFNTVIKRIEDVVYRQKFEHASVDLMNANIISRDLGLADTRNYEVDVSRKSTGDVFPESLSGEK